MGAAGPTGVHCSAQGRWCCCSHFMHPETEAWAEKLAQGGAAGASHLVWVCPGAEPCRQKGHPGDGRTRPGFQLQEKWEAMKTIRPHVKHAGPWAPALRNQSLGSGICLFQRPEGSPHLPAQAACRQPSGFGASQRLGTLASSIGAVGGCRSPVPVHLPPHTLLLPWD